MHTVVQFNAIHLLAVCLLHPPPINLPCPELCLQVSGLTVCGCSLGRCRQCLHTWCDYVPVLPVPQLMLPPLFPASPVCCIFPPMCWWNCCIPQSQFPSAWLLGVFQNCFSTYWLGEPWLFNFLSCLEILIMFTV